MTLSHIIVILSAVLVSAHAQKPLCSTTAKPIIIDTDIFSDVDDVGALTVANVLLNYGLADVRGIAVNTGSKYGALAASSINTYFGNGDIPIAAIRPLTNESFFDSWEYRLGEYASKVAYNFPRTLNDSSETPTPVDLYRSVLSAAEDASLTLISIGFLTNLADLLASPADNHSPLAGPALISSKVKELVIMGGLYPSGWEFNFGGGDPNSTYHVVNNWPRDVPVTYSGGELGGNIYSGQNLSEHAPADSPVLAAYQWYVGRCSTARESWDPLTTLYAICGIHGEGCAEIGIGELFKYGNDIGYNSVLVNGSNAWVNDTSVSNQHWLELADGVTNVTVSDVLNGLLGSVSEESYCLNTGVRDLMGFGR